MPQSAAIFSMGAPAEGSFGNTDWFTVRQAGQPELPQADSARSRLCQVYWKPVFQHILHSGYSWHDAQDLTQEFFARVLRRNALHSADRQKGKFRSFLLTLLKRFLSDRSQHDRTQKRGGGVPVISLDSGDTEFRQRIEPIDRRDPGTVCEREWVESVLKDALAQLERECALSGKSRIFDGLKSLVIGEHQMTCSQAAATLQLSEANVRVTVHRLRRRLRRILADADTTFFVRASRG